ncbi:hypothetical protein BH23GEM4_BH23GEM4_16820 [soil metagenome]
MDALLPPAPADEDHEQLDCPDIESSSSRYARRFAGKIGELFLEVQQGIALELLPPPESSPELLDVGGGHAQLAPALVEAGYRVDVLGSTPACGELLARHLDAERLRFTVGQLHDLPFEERTFDAAISFRILAHIADPERFIADLCRVAKRTVLVDFPSSCSVNALANRLFGLKLRVEGNTRPFRVFSPTGIRRSFEQNGFRVSGVRAQYFLPMAIHRLLGSAPLTRILEAPPKITGLTRVFGSPLIVRAERVSAA